MNTFTFEKELTIKIRPGQPMYTILKVLCERLGYNHPTALVWALLQREYVEVLQVTQEPLENLDKI